MHKNSHKISFSNSAQKFINPKSAQKSHYISFSKVHKNLEAILKVHQNLIKIILSKCTMKCQAILKVPENSIKISFKRVHKNLDAILKVHKKFYKMSFSNGTEVLETIPTMHENLTSIIFKLTKSLKLS